MTDSIEEQRPWIIIAGEMSDVDYCSTYGPYATHGDAQDDADRLVALGHITIDPDDQLDFRVCELFLPAPGQVPTEEEWAQARSEANAEDDSEQDEQLEEPVGTFFQGAPGQSATMPSHLSALLEDLRNGSQTLGAPGPLGGLNPAVLEGLVSGSADFMRELMLSRMEDAPDFTEEKRGDGSDEGTKG